MTVIASETLSEMGGALADHGRAAAELAALAESVHHDRERIAAQLSDRVVRKLFTVVLGLQGAAGAVDDERERATLLRLVRELDGAIVQIRSIAFDLDDRSAGDGATRGTPAA